MFAAQVAHGEIVRLPLVGHGFSVERNWLPQFRAGLRAAQRAAPTAAAAARGDQRPAACRRCTRSGTVRRVRAAADRRRRLGRARPGARRAPGRERRADRGRSTRSSTSGPQRTPEQTARDVARVLRHYLVAWNKQRVLLVGYSFGADVLPFVVNRLPPELRARVASVSLLGIDSNASFEVRVVGLGRARRRRSADAAGSSPRIAHLPVLCLYGEGEADSICPGLSAAERGTREQIGTGHHFSGEYATLAERILAFARSAAPCDITRRRRQRDAPRARGRLRAAPAVPCTWGGGIHNNTSRGAARMSLYIDSASHLHHDLDKNLVVTCPHCQAVAHITPSAVPRFEDLQLYRPRQVGRGLPVRRLPRADLPALHGARVRRGAHRAVAAIHRGRAGAREVQLHLHPRGRGAAVPRGAHLLLARRLQRLRLHVPAHRAGDVRRPGRVRQTAAVR